MPNVNIIQSDNPEGPANVGMFRYKKQKKRCDPEAILLKEYKKNMLKLEKNLLSL